MCVSVCVWPCVHGTVCVYVCAYVYLWAGTEQFLCWIYGGLRLAWWVPSLCISIVQRLRVAKPFCAAVDFRFFQVHDWWIWSIIIIFVLKILSSRTGKLFLVKYCLFLSFYVLVLCVVLTMTVFSWVFFILNGGSSYQLYFIDKKPNFREINDLFKVTQWVLWWI